MDKIWQVKDVDDLDSAILDQAAQFLQPFLPVGTEDIWSADYFNWKLGDSNPAGRGFITVATHKGVIVGVTSITRKRFWDGQKEVSVAEIGDTYSHPEYRRDSHAEVPYGTGDTTDDYLNLSIFGRLVTETRTRAEKAGLSLIYGTPNGNSMPGYVKRLGFFHLETHFNRYFVRPGSAGLIQQLPVLRPFRSLIHMVERIHAKLMRRLSSGGGKLQVREIESVGPEVDDLWERLKTSQRYGLLRDGAYFRHRFLENPLGRYQLWAVQQEGRICGVFVTSTRINPDGLLTRYLADWLLDTSVKGIFRFIVASWIAANGDKTTKSFSFWGESEWTTSQKILKLGCLGKNPIPIIFSDNSEARNLEKSDRVLDFTLATSDNI